MLFAHIGVVRRIFRLDAQKVESPDRLAEPIGAFLTQSNRPAGATPRSNAITNITISLATENVGARREPPEFAPCGREKIPRQASRKPSLLEPLMQIHESHNVNFEQRQTFGGFTIIAFRRWDLIGAGAAADCPLCDFVSRVFDYSRDPNLSLRVAISSVQSHLTQAHEVARLPLSDDLMTRLDRVVQDRKAIQREWNRTRENVMWTMQEWEETRGRFSKRHEKNAWRGWRMESVRRHRR